MAKRIYVGNLGFNTSKADLESLFSSYGTVRSADIIIERDTNRSKGFGFVEMSSDQEADDAIAALNGKDFGGRPLTVNEAKARPERSDRGGGGGSRSW